MSTATVAPGSSLGRFQIEHRLGAGGIGEVYRATDTKLGRTVALKVLPAQYADDPARRERFEREARAASALNHPNIVTLYDAGVEGDIPWIAMELVEGQTCGKSSAKGRFHQSNFWLLLFLWATLWLRPMKPESFTAI